MIRNTFKGDKDESPLELDLVLKQYEKKLEGEIESTTSSELALVNVYGESDTSSQSTTGKSFITRMSFSMSEANQNIYKREENKSSNNFLPRLMLVSSILILVGLLISSYLLLSPKNKLEKWPKIKVNRRNSEVSTSPHSMLNVFIKDDTVFSRGFPKSYSIFADNNFPIGNEIPLFFDLPGKTSELIPSALSNCLGFVAKNVLSSNTDHSHFLITNDLCDFASNFSKTENSQQVRLFLLLRNPLVRTVISYIHQGDPKGPYFNERVTGLTFNEYLNSDYVERNPLTRSLLCKKNSKLNQGYLAYATEFLKRRCIVGFLQDYKTALLGYRSLFKSEENNFPMSKDEILHCASQEFYASTGYLRENIIHGGNVANLVKNHLPSLMKVNNYDMQLYRFALNSLKDKRYGFESALP